MKRCKPGCSRENGFEFGAAAGIRTRVVCVAGRNLTRLDHGRQYPSYTIQWDINLLSRIPETCDSQIDRSKR